MGLSLLFYKGDPEYGKDEGKSGLVTKTDLIQSNFEINMTMAMLMTKSVI